MSKKTQIVVIFNTITIYLTNLKFCLENSESNVYGNLPISFFTYFNKELLTSKTSIINDYLNLIVYFAKSAIINNDFIHISLISLFETDLKYKNLKKYFDQTMKEEIEFLKIINYHLLKFPAIKTREDFLQELNKDFKKFIIDNRLEIEINKYLFCIIWEKFYGINNSLHEQIREVGIGSYKKEQIIGNLKSVSYGFKFQSIHLNKIEKIFHLLSQFNYLLADDYFIFDKVFRYGYINEKINWNGKKSTLYYFIIMLHSEEYLFDTSLEKWKNTALVFTILGEDLDFKKLRKLKKIKECETIDQIFENIKTDG